MVEFLHSKRRSINMGKDLSLCVNYSPKEYINKFPIFHQHYDYKVTLITLKFLIFH